MSGSLLRCLGLPELITASPEAYEALALRLARSPDELDGLRHRLARAKVGNALFDSARFCRHLEAAYLKMHARSTRGEPPASFRVPPLASAASPPAAAPAAAPPPARGADPHETAKLPGASPR